MSGEGDDGYLEHILWDETGYPGIFRVGIDGDSAKECFKIQSSPGRRPGRTFLSLDIGYQAAMQSDGGGRLRGNVTCTSVVQRTVSICETQPIIVHGLQCLFAQTDYLSFGSVYATPLEGLASLWAGKTDILIIEKGLDTKTVLEALPPEPAALIVWGMSMNEADALCFLQSGAKGVLRKSADVTTILACLRAVSEGRTWLQDFISKSPAASPPILVDLTQRERQVMEQVEQGLKNRESPRN